MCQVQVEYNLCTIIVLCQEGKYTHIMPTPAKFKLKPLQISNEDIGQRIARIRKTQGLNQSELAEKIGITRKLVTDYETGRTHMNDEMVVRFALALKISTDKLLGIKKDQFKKSNPSLRYTRRMREIEKLPEMKRRMILKVIDDLIRVNS